VATTQPVSSPYRRKKISDPYQKKVGDWLDSMAPWDFWFTITFRYPPSLPTVRRSMGRFAGSLSPTLMFWGSESGPCTGRNHVHGLLYFDENRISMPLLGAVPISAKGIWTKAFRAYGRTHVNAFDPERGAAHYVGKYVTKRLTDFDILNPEDIKRENSKYPGKWHGHSD